ncbi:MAG: hypothetical protein DMG02_33110 [Acidobacteria bacterium]|nr:MAG: hypothetical protein DMG02_33110 [Acidobacteriota bacterium]
MTFASPLFDFLRLSVWSTRGFVTATIGCLQEALVVALQFIFEDDAANLRTAGNQSFSTLNVCAIQPHVVCEFARLRDADMEGLTSVAVISIPSRVFQHRTSSFGQRDKRRPCSADDIRRRSNQSELSQMRQVPRLRFAVPVLVAQIRRYNDSKCPRS